MSRRTGARRHTFVRMGGCEEQGAHRDRSLRRLVVRPVSLCSGRFRRPFQL